MGEKILGYHAIEEALKMAPSGSTLFVCRNSEQRNERLVSLAKTRTGIVIRKIAKIEMDRMAPGADHRGVLLELAVNKREKSIITAISTKEYLSSLKEGQSALVLILDGITDVHNVGAILRSADQFSVNLVMLPERRSAQANETVQRISSGAALYVPIATVTNLAREITALKQHGFWIYGAEMQGQSLHSVKFAPRTALVIGSEGSGLSQLIAKSCDHIVSIPTTGHIDSLNVSVATGILLYEYRRQLP